MTADERDITGVENASELRTMRDALVDVARELGHIGGRMDAMEAARRDARVDDTHWKERMEGKTDRMYERIDALTQRADEVPTAITAAIADCREQREAVTAPVIAHDARRVTERRIVAWMGGAAIAIITAVAAITAILERLFS
jgi:hypothetical protein